MLLGAIGARSKHLRFFSQAIPDSSCRITHVCAMDAPELAYAQSDFVFCKTPQEVIEHSDAVFLLLREGYQHAFLAEQAMRFGKPVFVDKPFTCDFLQARRLCAVSAESGVPCTGGSTICFTPLVQELAAALPRCREYTLSYQADPFSPFGGWYFYGSHLTDLCTMLFGGDFHRVHAKCTNASVSAHVYYSDFTVTLRSSPQAQPPVLLADRPYILDDQNCYAAGMAHFLSVTKRETPGCTERLTDSVRLMDAILAALHA